MIYLYNKKKTMSLPTISFKEFAKNPIVALLFMCLVAIGYLYISQTNNFKEQIERLESDVEVLKKDNKELNDKIIQILSEVKKV